MKRLLAMLGLVLAIGVGAVALAAGQDAGARSPHAGGMPGGMGGMMLGGGSTAEQPWISVALQNRDQLGLTPEQVTRLESLRAEFQKEAIRRRADLEVAETELAELFGTESPDLGKVEAKLRQLEGLRTDLRLGRLKTLEKGKALLTPEQRKKLGSLGHASGSRPNGMMAAGGVEEMQRFMNSERMPQAMAAMMEVARRMGNGDTMAGMVRMMEMMGQMGQGGMMGGQGGMMAPTPPKPSQ